MNYFVIQIKTGGEEKYLNLAQNLIRSTGLPEQSTGRLLWPRRKMSLRKGGKKQEILAPIYPGYLFLEGEELIPEVYWLLKKINGFLRFLKNNNEIEPLSGEDRDILLHFLSFGEIVEKSKVIFDKDQRIIIIDGIMKGLEGKIIKVDKRKKRAKICISLYNSSFPVDFAFEVLEPLKEDYGKTNK